jgi:hypothetical protein
MESTMKRSILIVSCLVASFVWAGCNRSSGPKSLPIPSFTVEELLANPQGHSHTMVKVSGCFVTGFEKVALQSCSSKGHLQQIWVEDARFAEEWKKLALPSMPDTTPEKLQNRAAERELFAYDEGRNARAWQKLEASTSQDQMILEVVLLGQFETIAPRVPEPMYLGFGHLNAYTHELILVDVLSSQPHAVR